MALNEDQRDLRIVLIRGSGLQLSDFISMHGVLLQFLRQLLLLMLILWRNLCRIRRFEAYVDCNRLGS